MSKWLAHELSDLSLLSWTSRPLFAHIISFNKGVYLILLLKLFTIYLWCLAYTFCVLANNKSHQSTYTMMNFCLSGACEKKITKSEYLKNRPSTLDTSTKSQTHVRNSKKEETCQGHVLHFNELKGLAVEKAKNRPGRRFLLFSRLRRSVVLPRKPPCYAGYEHQQHSIWKTTNCHVTSHAVTPVSRK